MEVKVVHATILYHSILYYVYLYLQETYMIRSEHKADHIRSKRNTTVIGEKLLLTSMVTSRGTVGTVEQDFIWPPVLYS